MGTNKKIPYVDMDRSVTINNSTNVYSSFYSAFRVAAERCPKDKTYLIDERLYQVLQKFPNLYVDFIHGLYILYICSEYEGLFPRICIARFKDPSDLKDAVTFMQENFSIKREIRYHQDCI
jgi:hypothetical protein